jgi:hypothetical protein
MKCDWSRCYEVNVEESGQVKNDLRKRRKSSLNTYTPFKYDPCQVEADPWFS